MKKNIILTTVIIIIAFVSNINAQSKSNVVKFGVKRYGLVVDYERSITNHFGLIIGANYKKISSMEDYSYAYSENLDMKREGHRSNIMIGVRLYTKPQQQGWNFYAQPNLQIENFSGTERVDDDFIAMYTAFGGLATLVTGELAFYKVGRLLDRHKQPIEIKVNSNSIISALNIGAQYQKGNVIIDSAFGIGHKTNREDKVFLSGELKIGYAF